MPGSPRLSRKKLPSNFASDEDRLPRRDATYGRVLTLQIAWNYRGNLNRENTRVQSNVFPAL